MYIALLQSTLPALHIAQQQYFLKQLHIHPSQLLAIDTLVQQPTPECISGVQAVIISGSPYRVSQHAHHNLDALAAIVRHCVQERIPLLGICYGAHVMAYALGGRVEYAPKRREFGTRTIHVLPQAEGDSLFGGLPHTFQANCFRTDDITALPPHAIPLAKSDTIQFHAFKIAGAPAYAMQFHPEYDKAAVLGIMDSAYFHGSYFTDEVDYKQHKQKVANTPVTDSLLQKFVSEVVQLRNINLKLGIHS